MKFLVLALVLVAAVVANELYTADEIATLKTYSKECKESTHVDHDTLVQMRQRHFHDDQHLKDYLFCVSKKMHWMDDEGHMQKDTLKKQLAKSATATEAMGHCMDKHGSNGPETAYVVFKCYMEHLPADFKATL